ncbi:hypothetical protein LTR85_011253 [Meristemomyces frigidus]|nr:hypothetical protein LTR85_011253 [Meristemomyces frigidus]
MADGTGNASRHPAKKIYDKSTETKVERQRRDANKRTNEIVRAILNRSWDNLPNLYQPRNIVMPVSELDKVQDTQRALLKRASRDHDTAVRATEREYKSIASELAKRNSSGNIGPLAAIRKNGSGGLGSSTAGSKRKRIAAPTQADQKSKKMKVDENEDLSDDESSRHGVGNVGKMLGKAKQGGGRRVGVGQGLQESGYPSFPLVKKEPAEDEQLWEGQPTYSSGTRGSLQESPLEAETTTHTPVLDPELERKTLHEIACAIGWATLYTQSGAPVWARLTASERGAWMSRNLERFATCQNCGEGALEEAYRELNDLTAQLQRIPQQQHARDSDEPQVTEVDAAFQYSISKVEAAWLRSMGVEPWIETTEAVNFERLLDATFLALQLSIGFELKATMAALLLSANNSICLSSVLDEQTSKATDEVVKELLRLEYASVTEYDPGANEVGELSASERHQRFTQAVEAIGNRS